MRTYMKALDWSASLLMVIGFGAPACYDAPETADAEPVTEKRHTMSIGSELPGDNDELRVRATGSIADDQTLFIEWCALNRSNEGLFLFVLGREDVLEIRDEGHAWLRAEGTFPSQGRLVVSKSSRAFATRAKTRVIAATEFRHNLAAGLASGEEYCGAVRVPLVSPDAHARVVINDGTGPVVFTTDSWPDAGSSLSLKAALRVSGLAVRVEVGFVTEGDVAANKVQVEPHRAGMLMIGHLVQRVASSEVFRVAP